MNDATLIFLKKILFCVCICLFLQGIHAGNINGKIIDYHGIPGCTCFFHCDCYCDEKRWCEASAPQNIVWHTFMKAMKEAKRLGPYFPGNLCLNVGYFRANDCSMLSEYLNGITIFRGRLENEAAKTIEWYKKYYSSRKETEKFREHLDRIGTQLSKAKTILEQVS